MVLIDTGKILDCDIMNLFKYCGTAKKFVDLPARCFKCSLAQLQPSQIRYPNGFWPNEAVALFKRFSTQKLIEIEVQTNFTHLTSL